MVDQTIAVALFELLVSAIAAVLAYAAWQYRDRPGGSPLVVTGVGVIGWAFMNGIPPLLANRTLAFAADLVLHLFAALASIGFFYVAVEYTDSRRLQGQPVLAFFAGLWLLEAVVVATNPIHGQFIRNLEITAAGNVVEVPGPLFWVHTVIWVGLTFVTLGLFFRTFLKTKGIYRRQTSAILLGGILGLALIIVNQFIEFVPGLSFSIVGVTIFCGTLLWAIFVADFLETAPVARELLIENMEDAVIAVNTQDCVVDINPSAMAMLDVDESAIGASAREVFETYPALAACFEANDHTETEISREQGDETAYYEVAISPVVPERADVVGVESTLGSLVVVRDVTVQRRREAQLRERERELALLKDLQSRFLRHNLRNRLNVILTSAELLLDEDRPQRLEGYETIVAESEKLLDWGTKARSIERLVEQSERGEYEIGPVIESTVEELRATYPDVTFELDVAAAEIIAVPQVHEALEGIIDNAARYNTAGDPWVEVSTQRQADKVQIRVADNGPGLSDHEIEAIRDRSETKLKHGSGFGLWLAYWVVEKSDGHISFTVDDGTTVELTFDRAS